MKSYPIQVLFREYLEGILAAVFLALFLRFFMVTILYIPTDNMEPALQRGDFVIGWRPAYGLPLPLMRGERFRPKTPARGDVISFRFPGDDEQIIVRRVVGLPGDQVAISAGQVFVNGNAVDYKEHQQFWLEKLPNSQQAHPIIPNPLAEMPKVVVPTGSYFVLSDNRKRTDDSRDWGFVPFNNIESRLLLIWLSVDNSEEDLRIVWPRILAWIE